MNPAEEHLLEEEGGEGIQSKQQLGRVESFPCEKNHALLEENLEFPGHLGLNTSKQCDASVSKAPQGARKLPKWDQWVGKGVGLDHVGVQEPGSRVRVGKNLDHGASKEGESSNGGRATNAPPSKNPVTVSVTVSGSKEGGSSNGGIATTNAPPSKNPVSDDVEEDGGRITRTPLAENLSKPIVYVNLVSDVHDEKDDVLGGDKEVRILTHGDTSSSIGGKITKTPPSKNPVEQFVSTGDLASDGAEKDGVLGGGNEGVLQEGKSVTRGETSSPPLDNPNEQYVTLDDYVLDDDFDEDDIIAMAINAGWKFPRPRWWPPGGYGRGSSRFAN